MILAYNAKLHIILEFITLYFISILRLNNYYIGEFHSKIFGFPPNGNFKETE